MKIRFGDAVELDTIITLLQPIKNWHVTLHLSDVRDARGHRAHSVDERIRGIEGEIAQVDPYGITLEPGNGECAYEFDGYDTDGSEWHRCTTHDELAPGTAAPCAGYQEIPYQADASLRDQRLHRWSWFDINAITIH